MTYNDFRQIITQRLVDWSNVTGVKIYTDNRKMSDITSPVVKLDIVYGPTRIQGRNTAPVTSRTGNLALRIFAPKDSGSAASYDIAEQLQNIFSFVQWDTSTHTYEGQIAPSPNSNLYQINLLIRFRYNP